MGHALKLKEIKQHQITIEKNIYIYIYIQTTPAFSHGALMLKFVFRVHVVCKIMSVIMII